MDENDAQFWGLVINEAAQEWAERIAFNQFRAAARKRPLMILLPPKTKQDIMNAIAAGALGALAELWQRDFVDTKAVYEIVRTDMDGDTNREG